MRRVFTLLAREVRGIHTAAYLLGFFALLSQTLALVRDRIFAHTFGAGEILDTYYAAFKIPDVIFVAVGSMVSLSVVVPFLAEKIEQGDAHARKFTNTVFSVFAVTILGVSAVVFFLTPALVRVFFPTLAEETGGELVALTRLMLLSPIFLGISSLLGSITQIHKRFFLYATSPLLYNVGIIAGVLFLYPAIGIMGLGLGVALGAFLHVIIQVPFLFERRLLPTFTLEPQFRDVVRLARLSLPRTLALSAHQLTLLLLIALASRMGEGSVSVFTFAFNLQSVPLSIIGISYSVAAFPTLARLFSRGERTQFVHHITTALRHIIFWSVPALTFFIVLRAQIVRVILGSGEFGWPATRLTAAALALFVVSLLAQSAVLLFVRGYYAAGNTRKPLFVNLASSAVVVVSALVLRALGSAESAPRLFLQTLLDVEDVSGTSVLILPFAFSFGMVINAVWLWALFRRDFSGVSLSLWRVFVHTLLAASAMGAVSFGLLNVLDDVFNLNTLPGVFLQGFLAGAGGIAAGVLVLRLLRNPEVEEIVRAFRGRIWRARALAPGHEEG